MTDDAAILFANEAFYTAFANRDIAAMDALWDDGPVLCVHPGWPPLVDRELVMESWRGILDGNPPEIEYAAPQICHWGDMAMVVCFELLPGSRLVAANGFTRRGATWRMVHHQAGPTTARPSAPPASKPPMN